MNRKQWGKGEIARYAVFLKDLYCRHQEPGLVWEWVSRDNMGEKFNNETGSVAFDQTLRLSILTISFFQVMIAMAFDLLLGTDSE